MTLKLDSNKSKFVPDLAVLAAQSTESTQDALWFNKLHPAIVKPFCAVASSSESENNTVNPPNYKGARARNKLAAQQRAKNLNSNANGAMNSTSRAKRGGTLANSTNVIGRKPSAAVGKRKSRNSGTHNHGNSNNDSNSRRGGSNKNNNSVDDDIMALLAQHNKQFKPKSRYVARAHSSRDVKKWEVGCGLWLVTCGCL